MKKCDLAIFVDRCFEGYYGERPVRLLDFQPVKTDVGRIKLSYSVNQ